VDATDGGLRVSDTKTGRPKADQKGADKRTDALRELVAAGTLLQASAYAFSRSDVPVEGRLVYLKPDLADETRVLVAPASPADREAFEAVVRTLLAALDTGCFLPRMRQASKDVEPRACTFCEVKDACLRGDSGARARLGSWASSPPAAAPLEHAARSLWELGE
jgi:hypothetical protein